MIIITHLFKRSIITRHNSVTVTIIPTNALPYFERTHYIVTSAIFKIYIYIFGCITKRMYGLYNGLPNLLHKNK